MLRLSHLFEAKPRRPIDLSDRVIAAQLLCPRLEDEVLYLPVYFQYKRRADQLFLLDEQKLWEYLFAFSEDMDKQSVRQLEIGLRAMQEVKRSKGLRTIPFEQDMVDFTAQDFRILAELVAGLTEIYENSPLYRIRKRDDNEPGLGLAA